MAYRTSRGVNDLVLLDKITNEGILECLQSHYAGDEIYVYIGQVLISVNPFKEISGLYSSSTCKKYPGKNEHQNAPHVFAIAERAYRGMVQDLTKECVIISGESGAGKTEASKKIMEYIAAVSSKSSDVARVKEQLLESNPLLEAFGNAKTLRNNNSSRFGKYMEIQFDIADPVGGRISVYLLEKNRVIERQQGERAFHIFYQLLAGASGEESKSLGLGKPSDFQYLNNSNCDTVEDMNDGQEFKHTRQAMSVIGLNNDVQRSIFRLLSAILHLGNIDFSKAGTGSTSNSQHMQIAATLLGLSTDTLLTQLTTKKIKTNNETIVSPLNVEQAYYARDSLAKGIYGRLFQWLVDAANQSIHVEFFSNSIGVLDIYGFEIFGVNGFEQLCINYVNEKLHQLFIELTLKAEQEEYSKEGITWQTIDYYNNLPIVLLIEGRGQIFSLLDEESIFPQGTDNTLYAKLNDQLRGNNNYKPVDGKDTPRGRGAAGGFVVRHYAGEVAYTTTGMLDKNKDLLFPNLVEMAITSNHDLLPTLFQADFARLKEDKKRPITSCVQFKNSVSALMDTLSSCRQNYIRCIKPNEDKRPGRFDNGRVMDQIKYLGLLENVKVRRAGFAYRIPYSKFLAKYKACSKHHVEFKEEQRVAAEKLMKEFGLKDYELGRSKIFIRSPKTLFELEDMRTAFLQTCASRIPKEDQLIYADKVVAYDREKKGFHLFILTAQHLFLFQDKKAIHTITIQNLGGISIGGEHADGFLVIHCQETNKKGEVTNQFDVLVEDVYKAELIAVHEVLKSCGIEIELRRTDNVPSFNDANFIPPKGTKAHRGKCSIM